MQYIEPLNNTPVYGVTNEYTITVAPINIIRVIPDNPPFETISPNADLTARFDICNDGNQTMATMIQTVSATNQNVQILRIYRDMDGNGVFSPGDVVLTLNQSSFDIPYAMCAPVLVDFHTGNIPQGANFEIVLTARATGPNSNGTDAGNRRYTLNRGAVLEFVKTVNGQSTVNAQIGDVVDYRLRLINNGDAAAQLLVLNDIIQAGVYVPNSIKINGVPKTDAVDGDEAEFIVNRVTARVPVLPTGNELRVDFQLQVNNLPNGTSIPNFATGVSPSLAAQIVSNTTQIIVNPKGIIFDGESGVNTLVPNSQVSLTDEQGNPVNLSGAPAFPLNPTNANPFTAPTGEYSFGMPCRGATYFLNASAAGFTTRRMQLVTTVVATAPCSFNYVVTSLDGLPIAGLDGGLTNNPVESANMAGLFSLIPLFKAGAISTVKTVDRSFAQIGDILQYRVDFTNNSNAFALAVRSRDVLPRGFHIAENSMEILRAAGGRVPVAFTVSGNVVTAPLGTIPAHQTVTIFYKVRIGVDANKGRNTNVVVATDADGRPISDEGRATVVVRYGLESEKQTLLGRVFIDKNGDGVFNLKDGDEPVVNAQIVTSQGKSALTDAEGKYSIPAFPAGKLSVGLIRNTIPEGLLTRYGNSQDGDWSQLLTSPLGVAMIQTADFPLVEAEPQPQPQAVRKEEEKARVYREMTMPEYLRVIGSDLSATESVKIVVKSDMTGKSAISAAVQYLSTASVTLYLNDVEIPETQIGERIQNGATATVVYYNLNLQDGENKLTAVAKNAQGEVLGKTEKTVRKGGKAVRFAIKPRQQKASAGGREAVDVQVVALDKDGFPAEDSEVMLTASGGSFRKEKETTVEQDAIGQNNSNRQTGQLGAQQQIVRINNGSGIAKLTSPVSSGRVDLFVSRGYGVVTGETTLATTQLNFTEPRPVPTIIGFGEFFWGRANPGILQQGRDTFFSGRASLWGRVPLFGGVLTGAYQSNMPLNRDEDFDKNLVNRLSFNNFNFEEGYSIFGDSSQRFTLAPSNTKAFARWERGLSFVQFGDFAGRQKNNANGLFSENPSLLRLRQTQQPALETDNAPKLAAYNRNLTGLQIHLEDKKGNLFEIAGARPDTSFGRDIASPAGISRVKLSAADILFGTETVIIETRDRRAPERIVKRENLIRDIDYEIDYLTGVIFLKSNLALFDEELNPNQVVISYEYKGGKTSNVVLARAEKTFGGGKYRFGGTLNYTDQAGTSPYILTGVDFRAKLPNGQLEFEIARTQGQALGFGNNFAGEDSSGWAVLGNWSQKFGRFKANVNFITAQDGFNNPYGGIIQRGSTRLLGQLEYDVTSRDAVRVQAGFDRTATENFDNSRSTLGVAWKRRWSDKFSTVLGYDYRSFSDDSGQFGDRQSHLLTAGLNWNPTKKLSLSIVREQNLSGQSDPAYPNNTLLQAEYRLDQWSKFFVTNRFGGQINPIGDSSQIVAYQSKREFNAGFETKFKRGTSLMSAYRNEDGLNGQESFAVAGVTQKFKFRKNWAMDAGYQFALKLKGTNTLVNQSNYHNLFGGVTYAKENAFTANARYEFKNRLGNANLFSTGIAGKINQDWTMLGKFSFAQADQTFDKSFRKSSYGQLAGAFRPKDTDKYGMLFQYQFRDFGYRQNDTFQAKSDARHFFTVDSFYQPNAKWSFFGKTGMRLVSQTENEKSYATWMSLLQGRAEYRFAKAWDVGTEARWIREFKTNSSRFGGAVEVGFWATPELRLSGGYNYQQKSSELFRTDQQKGFYVTITTKLDRYFNWFGSKKPSGTK